MACRLSPHPPSPKSTGLRFLAGAVIVAAFAGSPADAKPKWDPVPPADLAATECAAYPGSSAEVLFHRNTFGTSGNSPWSTEYLRIKVYSPKGVEEKGVFNIDYESQGSVWDLYARVTKPDGTAAEFGKESFTDVVLKKTSESKIKRKTLAIPNLGVGDVVEMQWSRSVTNRVYMYYAWNCQDVVPVREYIFEVTGSINDYSLYSFNVVKSEIKSRSRYEARLEMRDLPPFESEPAMIPERDVRGWFLLLFSDPYLRWYSKPGELWKLISTQEEEEFRLRTKPSSAIKARTQELIRGATSDADRLARLYDFCQDNVTNLDFFDSPELQEAKKRLEGDDGTKQSPNQTLQRKTGYSRHVNELFASMARAAGYEVRLALCASRNDMLNIKTAKGWMFVDDRLVAVQVGGDWALYCPGDYYVPAGMIHRSNEFAAYLRCEEDKVVFGDVPVSVAEKSPVARKAHLRIDADGNLEGEVEVSMGGHAGSWRKQAWSGDQQAEIDERFRAGVTDRLPGAEVTEIAWENLRGRKLPLVVRYKVKVPGYAEAAGSKLIFAPNYFEHKAAALFTAEDRRFPIMFDYARAEHDDIEITCPEGFNLQAPSAPDSVGDPDNLIGVRYRVAYTPKSRMLTYHRDFALGGNGAIAFQAASYPRVKRLTDAIRESDEHSLVLTPTLPAVQTAPPAPDAAPAPAAPEAAPDAKPQAASATP